jgi:hypothetical protein
LTVSEQDTSKLDGLSRLLSDAKVRAEFRVDPSAGVRRLGLPPECSLLDPDQLEAQAQTLLVKRVSAVKKLLPDTFETHGLVAFERFFEFAQQFWPAGDRKHPVDAAAFAGFLSARGLKVFGTERNRAEFLASGARMRVRLVADAPLLGQRRPAVQILLRTRIGFRELAIYWAISVPKPSA